VLKLRRPARALADPLAFRIGLPLGALAAGLVIAALIPSLAQGETTTGGTASNKHRETTTSDSQTTTQAPPAPTAPTTTTAPAAPGGFGTRTLRRGARGADVRVLQRLLGQLRFPTTADGIFGPGTERRVRGWERSVHGLVDGVVTRGQAAEMLRRAARVSSQSQPQSAIPVDGHVFPVRGSHSFGTAENRFGAPRDGHTHQGQDILASSGTPVASAAAGRVSAVGNNSGAGNYLVVWADDGTDMVYMHLQSAPTVAEGQRVSAGQIVGRVGCTGSCSGSHLHFELWTPHWYDGGQPFDPLPRLRAWDAVT
jgi:murein DD-endopeptidase MepM/ murein hydrolase activator NlpD